MKFYLATILTMLLCTSALQAQVAVIANKSVPADQIKKSELLDFYTLDIKAWSNGVPVVLFDLQVKTDVRDNFYDFIGRSSSRMKSIWMKKLLSGDGDPPKPIENEEDLVKKVAETPGAIGYVSSEKATAAVKTLLLIEKKDEE